MLDLTIINKYKSLFGYKDDYRRPNQAFIEDTK